MRTGRYLIGLDAGTTSIKGILVRADGRILATASREYSLEYPGPDRCELDPEVYWENTRFVIRRLLRQSGTAAKQIRAVAFSSQAETLIPVDAHGRPLRKAIVWLDNRSAAEAAEIKARFGTETVLRVTGQPEIVPMWPATRLLWMRTNEPDIFRRIHKVLLVQDFLMHRLTGRFVTDESMVSSTLVYDIVRKTWWSDMLDFLGVSADALPEVLPCGTPVGPITREAARATGLSESTLVVTGAYDHAAGAVGCGNIREGLVSETTGTAMAMVVTLERPMFDPRLRISCHCHAVPGLYFLLPYGQTAGFTMKWFKETFGEPEIRGAGSKRKDPYAVLDALAERVPAGSDGLTMLPHLMGAGSPEFDEKARGVFCGIAPSMGKGHFARAILESVACMVRMNLETLAASGVSVKEIRALGGGARSRLWNRIKADCTGIPYRTSACLEPTSLGAAILAGVGCGVYANLEEGCAAAVRIQKTHDPDPKNADAYRKVFENYQKLTQYLTPYWQSRGV